jgi:hypothetical protein
MLSCEVFLAVGSGIKQQGVCAPVICRTIVRAVGIKRIVAVGVGAGG